MFGLESLDVLIGLVTVYLLFGIVCTAFFEAIASWFSFRSSNLEAALGELLSGNLKPNLPFVKAFYAHPLIQTLSEGEKGRPSYIPAEIVGRVIHSLLVDNESGKNLTEVVSRLPNFGACNIKREDFEATLRALPLGQSDDIDKFINAFYDDKSIKDLSKDTNGKPTLVPADLIGKVVHSLLHTLPSNGDTLKLRLSNPPPQTEEEFVLAFNSKVPLENRIKSLLETLVLDTQNDVEKFRKAVEAQFDAAMDRASGWFKRTQQVWTLFISAFVVLACNVDTLAIAHSLSTNPEVRAKLVVIAEKKLEESNSTPKKADSESETAKAAADKAAAEKTTKPSQNTIKAATEAQAQKKADEANDAAAKAKTNTAEAENSLKDANAILKAAGLPLGWPDQSSSTWLMKFAGLFISFCAVSLGAPFWFDVLQRFMRVRGAGLSPAESKEKKKS